nr:uncharacterized protein K02A2.6-like [Pseudochaenichthys georgianus]
MGVFVIRKEGEGLQEPPANIGIIIVGVEEKQASSEEEDNGASGVVESTEGEGKEPSMSDLVALLQAHMGQTEAQMAKQSEITTRQEQRFETMRQQFQLLQLEVQARTSPVPDSLSADPDPSEVEVLPSTSNHPQYDINPETYRQRFRSLEFNPDESPKELYSGSESVTQDRRWRLLDWLTSLLLPVIKDSNGAITHGVQRIDTNQLDSTIRRHPPVWTAKEKEPGAELDFNKDEYVLQNGILYRQQGSVLQLVVPQAVRDNILSLGHSIPWAGHLGKHKTIARIQRYFHWPGLRREVTQFCRSCPQCQITSARTPSRAPLQPLPIIGTPFERLGMDIVGPVERSKGGNRYMLVITDYATKYPEVFPLKSIKAKSVAFCLVQFFSRVGFPHEILTDQGTNFMSTLLKQVYHLLGIRSLRTTPYHPQTDGLTERFNQTLKQMLRKFVNNSGTDWDQWLPYLLFAYREVPQASTGFSPFELLYGHEVRGPLSLLREIWEGNKARDDSVNIVSYVVQMRDRLEKMSRLAQSHMAVAQQQQKSWYDRSARQRSFNPGQKTDASDRGLGAVLLQGSSDNRHPVAYISRKLFPREVRYSTVEKEALAIKWVLDSLRYYLLGREFTLETDHKALQWMGRMKDTNGRITRWYLALQPFRFHIQHIPGKDNVTADYLSRCFSESLEGGGSV